MVGRPGQGQTEVSFSKRGRVLPPAKALHWRAGEGGLVCPHLPRRQSWDSNALEVTDSKTLNLTK